MSNSGTNLQDAWQKQASFWRGKDKDRLAREGAAAAAETKFPPSRPPPFPRSLKSVCQLEMGRLRASFKEMARREKEETGSREVQASEPDEGGKAEGGGTERRKGRTEGGKEGEGSRENRLTGMAVTLHGGASLAWERR